MFSRRAVKPGVLVVVLGVAGSFPHVWAGVLGFRPYLTLGEIYTDNLFLAPPGTPREDAFITEIEPGFRLNYTAPRLQGNIDYSLQGLLYPGHSDMNHAYNRLNADGTLEAVRDWLYIDGRTIYGHQVVDPEKTGGRSNLFGGGNRASYSATTLSPYLMHDFGSVGVATLRYAYGHASYSQDIPATDSNTWSFLLARQPQYGPLTYELFYVDQELNQHRGEDLSFKRARVGLQYHVSTRTALLADAGKENNFRPDGTIDELGATFWDVGASVNTEEDTFKALFGHRFFGTSYDFEWHHDGADFHTDMSYREEPTNYNRLLLGRQPTTLVTAPLPYAKLPSLRNRRLFILKRAAVGMAFDLSDSQIRVRLYDEHRDYIQLDETDHVLGGRFEWQFALGIRDALVPAYSYRRYEFRDGQIDYYYRSEIQWRHQLSRSLRLRLALRNERRNSQLGKSYRVNTAVLELTKYF